MLTLKKLAGDNPRATQEESGNGDNEAEDAGRDINYGSQEMAGVAGQASQTMLAISEQIAQDMWLDYQSYLVRHRLD